MEITFERSGALYSMAPWLPKLTPLLSYTRREFKFSQWGGKSSKPSFHNEELFTVQEDGSAVFPAGLFQRVARTITKLGHTYKVTDHRDLKALMPMPDFTRIDKLRPGQDKILTSVAASDGGQLVGGTGIGKSFIIAQICKMYPTLRIVVVSPRKPVVQTLYENIGKATSYTSVGQIGGGKNHSPDHRIIVTTTKSLLKADLEKCDLLMFDEVHGVGYNQISTKLAYIQKARKFGFTATPTGRGDNAELVIEALFGPVLCDIPYEDAIAGKLVTPIEVHKYTVDNAYMPLEGSIVTRKRHGYWRNKNRNEMIAAVAKSTAPEEQVLIMVETLEHAIYLHKLLPDYRVVHCGSVSTKKKQIAGRNPKSYRLNDKQLSGIRRRFERGEIKKAISTTTWKEGVDFPGLSVLIRADGMTSPIASNQIPGRLSRLAEGKVVGVLVDFEDKFTDWALSRAHRRFKIYRDTGWKVIKKVLI